MWRFLAVLAVAGALFASAFAAAATLDVKGGVVQAGSDNTLVCDADGIYVIGYGTELDNLSSNFIKIGGIADACVGAEIGAAVYDNGGSQVGSNLVGTVTATGPNNDRQVTLNYSSAKPSLSSIYEVHVAIGGSGFNVNVP